MPKIFVRFVKTAFYISRRTFRWLGFFRKTTFPFNISRVYLQKLSHSWWKNFGKLVKNVIWVSTEKFWGKKIWKEETFLNHFLSLSKRTSKFGKKIFCRAVNFAFYVSRWTFWGNFFWKKINFLWFSYFERKIFWLLPIFLAGSSKLHITSHEECFVQ